MDEKLKGELKKLAKLTRDEIGENENSVKFNFIIPFLGCFGHVKLDFEHSSQGGRIDILIGNKSSCGIVVETKGYDKNLDKYLPQLKGYCDEKRPLLAIIANGEEIRAYSPLWRVSNFSETILYSIKRNELSSDEIIERLEKLLSKENLENEKLDDHILERENEIKNGRKEIEALKSNYKNQVDEIQKSKKELENKIKEIQNQISEKDKEISELKKKEEEEIRGIKEKYRLPITEQRIIQPIIVRNRDKETKIDTSQLNPNMSMVDLAYNILKLVGGPMHYKDIWKRMEEIGYKTTGKTPERSVNANMCTDKRFVRVGRGVWTLKEGNLSAEMPTFDQGVTPDFEVKEGDKIEIFASHKRELYKATYYSQNKIVYNGIVYTSPSAACRAITKTSCNGWVFWKFKDENGKEHLLSELRKQKKN